MDGGSEEKKVGWHQVTIESGEWAGWQLYDADPFEELAGPFYHRADREGRPQCAFRAEAKHMNGGGFMHGGAIMTFADYCLFVIARDAIQNTRCVTATFNGEFVGAVPKGAWSRVAARW